MQNNFHSLNFLTRNICKPHFPQHIIYKKKKLCDTIYKLKSFLLTFEQARDFLYNQRTSLIFLGQIIYDF